MAPLTTEQIIALAVEKFAVQRGSKTIHAGGRSMRVHTPGERVLHLPNGATVKVTTDESGVSTQVEEDEAMHAVVRPQTFKLRLKQGD